MYRKLKMEMARVGWNIKELAENTGITYSTLTGKVRGDTPFTLDECVLVKRALGSTLELEELFARH